MNILKIIYGDFSITPSEYDPLIRPKISRREYLTNTISNLELKCVYTNSCTSLYLTNKENLHKLKETILVIFSNHNEIKLEFNKKRTLKNPIFLGKN